MWSIQTFSSGKRESWGHDGTQFIKGSNAWWEIMGNISRMTNWKSIYTKKCRNWTFDVIVKNHYN